MAQSLPDRLRPQGAGSLPGASVRAGSWWRLTGDFDSREHLHVRDGALPPEEPLTLLVTEVRIHDGDIHSVHVGYHPAWGEGVIKFLADEFFANFVELDVAEAEARRAREIAALMGRSQEIAFQISQGPREEEVLAIGSDLAAAKLKADEEAEARRQREAAGKKAAAAARARGASYGQVDQAERDARRSVPDRVPLPQSALSGTVPAALLPSGNVLAAQVRIQSEITRMEATQKWIAERAREMTETMRVVGTFQKEKVSAVTAGISDRTRQAHDMLAKVQTMKLFLGDDVKLWEVAEGDSAAPEERLHLMQGMLYLDEELLVEGMFGKGFRHSDLHTLPDILAAHPDLVQRMMPHPRCVAIARVRRESAGIDVPTSGSFHQMLRSVWTQIEEEEADKRIFILIRDGANVRVAIADEQTSKAERLFPSRAEIDGIYQERSFGGSKREISPQDIEYSDRRNKHDSRALFYKRFLIMLWGLHEREGAFGPFMPKGMNWLEESVASDRFNFVHDEENVLTDGKESVLAWLHRGHDDLRPGAEVLVDTWLAMTEGFAPTAFKEQSTRDGFRTYRDRDPISAHVRTIVARQGDELVVQIPTRQGYKDREMNTPLIVRTAAGDTPDGVLNLGTATAGKVRSYMNSRLERQNYLRWFGLFHAALPILEDRRIVEKPVLDRVMAAGVAEEPATRAIALFRETVRGNRLPQTNAEIARVTLNARAIAAPEDFAGGDVLALRLKASGKVTRVRAAPPRDGIVLRALELEEDGQRSVVPFAAANPRGEALILGAKALREHWSEILQFQTPGLILPEDLDILDAVDGQAVADLLSGRSVTEEWARAAAEQLVAANEASQSKHVVLPGRFQLAGAVVVPTRVRHRDMMGSRLREFDEGTTTVFSVTFDPMAVAAQAGFVEIARGAAGRIVAAGNVDRLMNRWLDPGKKPVARALVLTSRRETSRIALHLAEDSEHYRLRPADADGRRIDMMTGKPVAHHVSDDQVIEVGLRALDQFGSNHRKEELLKAGRQGMVVFGEEGLLALHRVVYPDAPGVEGPAEP